jgi:hypothetical protein
VSFLWKTPFSVPGNPNSGWKTPLAELVKVDFLQKIGVADRGKPGFLQIWFALLRQGYVGWHEDELVHFVGIKKIVSKLPNTN